MYARLIYNYVRELLFGTEWYIFLVSKLTGLSYLPYGLV